ncbi:MAG: hypothetical protein P8Y70_04580 [Candidatus Lokiarchaeota archaeon]
MNERDEKENLDDFDPTKEAFFSDMSEIEEEIAAEAYQIVEHALSLIQSEYFDDAIEFLRQAVGLYQQIDRKAEMEALINKISEVHVMKENAFIEQEKEIDLGGNSEEDVLLADNSDIEIKKDERITEIKSNLIPINEIGKNIQDNSKIGSEEESIKAGELERNKELQERELRGQIEKRIENAEKLGREYEFEFKKAIKEGKLDIPSKYPEILDIYSEARNTALDMGWNEEAMIYSTQIRKFKELFEREKQVRILEGEKAQKDKEFEELLKTKQSEKLIKYNDEKIEISSQELNLEKEEQRLREQIEKVIQNAEKMGREYEIEFKKAIKKGNLDINSKYPKIIEIYSEARETALSKGWKNEAKIYSTHIRKYKELLDFTNALTGVTIESFVDMGLTVPLMWNQMANSFVKDRVQNLLKDSGLNIEGSDVKSITEDFAKKIKETGFCQRANVLEAEDSKVVIDLGECVLAPITKVIRGNDLNMIPPCPMMALLYGTIENKTGKRGSIEKAEWKPQENTTIFTLKLEE